MKNKALFAWITMVLAFLFSASIYAETGGSGDIVSSRTCPDAKLFSGKLITDVCWDCLFPIKIMGAPIGGGKSPAKSANKMLCACYDNLGVPEPGLGIGYWEPARMIEIVREAGCSPSLGGMKLPGANRRMQGLPGYSPEDKINAGFYHYHYYAMPLLYMLDLFIPNTCFSDGMMDFDIMYLSELDPTWNNDQLAFFTNPEAAAVANVAAQAACPIDAAAAAVGVVNDSMWWCAGAWGSLYPLSGMVPTSGFANMTSLASVKALAALHRRGLALRTMGDDAMCRERIIDPLITKSQYKFNMFFPVAEARKSHVFGETVTTWGQRRLIPAFGEDALYMIWRWNDCCMKF